MLTVVLEVLPPAPPPAPPPPVLAPAPDGADVADQPLHADRRLRVPAHVDVVDLVGLDVRRVGRDQDGPAIQAPAQIPLLRDPVEDRGQRLVDGVEAHQALQARMDVDVLLRVPGQREQQFLDRHLVHHHAVGGQLRLRLGRRRRRNRHRREDPVLTLGLARLVRRSGEYPRRQDRRPCTSTRRPAAPNSTHGCRRRAGNDGPAEGMRCCRARGAATVSGEEIISLLEPRASITFGFWAGSSRGWVAGGP